MICPRCAHAVWRVDRSVTAEAPPLRKAFSRRELDQVQTLVGWYTQDFVFRRRVCPQCEHRDIFVELTLDDLSNLIKERVKDILEGKCKD